MGHPNHDASLTSKAFITSAHVGDHDANPTNTTISSTLEFVLSSLATVSNEQYESIPDDEIALLVRKFYVLYKFHKERRTSPKGCFECDNTTHFIVDCLKRRSLTPPTSTTTPMGMTPVIRVTTRRSTTLGTRRRRSFKRSCAERVQPLATSTSPVMTPSAQRRMRRSNVSKVTSPAFVSSANL
jgi:hypothetical protein